ncbi:MAG: DNA repair protein RadA, partial [Myxococcota bacterium]
GEIRRVARSDLRVAEALRLGFRRVLLPEAASEIRGGAAAKALVEVRDLASALAWLRAEARSTAT